jgi:hypothetical protein
MIKINLTVLMLFWGAFLSAQKNTVSGTLKDAGSGEDLIGATVIVKELKGIGAVANVYGFYSLSLQAGTYTLIYSSLGYTSIEKKVVLTESTQINIELAETATSLNEFVVTSENENKNISKVEMGIEKISPKSIETIPVLLGEKDVIKTLTLTPGIKSAGEGSGGFSVRGGGVGQNLILLDESVVYNASHLLGFFSVFNSDALKDATLYKGGAPAEFGGRGSSVMNITMRDGNNKKFAASGGLGIIASRLTIEGPIVKNKSSFIISARRSYADMFLKLSKKEELKSSRLYFYDLNLKANYQINQKNRIYLSGYFGKDVLAIKKQFLFDWGNLTGTVRWNYLLNDKLFLNTSFIASKYNYQYKIGEKKDGFGVKAFIQDYSLKQDYSYFKDDKNTIKFGFNAIHHTFAPGELFSDTEQIALKLKNKEAIEGAVYLQNEQKITGLLSLQYGVRYSLFYSMGNNDTVKSFNNEGEITGVNYYEKGKLINYAGGFSPRISAKYLLNETSSLKLSYNRNYQYLHLLSNSASSDPTDAWVPSSNNIKPQIIDQVALGWFKNYKENRYQFSVEGYYKNLQNQIDYKNGADLFLNGDVEKELVYGKGIAYGTEFYLKKKKGKFTGWVSYTFSRSLRKFEKINKGKYYPARQDIVHDISLVGMYKLSERWALSATWVYSSGIAATFPQGKYEVEGVVVPSYSDRNGARFPAYHRLDLGATLYSKKTAKFESSWNFSVYNAYGRANAFSIAFKQNPENPSENIAEQTSLFKIIPSITYNFNF